MAHEILQQPKIVAASGERVPGAMAKRCRPHIAKTCASSRLRDEVVHSLAGQLDSPRSEMNSQGSLSVLSARYRLIARSSSPSIGLLGIERIFPRRIQTRACLRLSWSSRIVIASETRKAWRYIMKSSR